MVGVNRRHLGDQSQHEPQRLENNNKNDVEHRSQHTEETRDGKTRAVFNL
jgi:hypothetical protein